MSIKVLAECVDLRTGARFYAGEEFSPAPTPDQAARLVKAGCLPASAVADAEQAISDVTAEADAMGASQGDLVHLTKAELQALAAERGIDTSMARTKADLLACFAAASSAA